MGYLQYLFIYLLFYLFIYLFICLFIHFGGRVWVSKNGKIFPLGMFVFIQFLTLEIECDPFEQTEINTSCHFVQMYQGSLIVFLKFQK